jgi:hypothetical protein
MNSTEYNFDRFYQKKSKKLNFIPHSSINTVSGPKNSKKSKKIKPNCLFYVSYFKFLYNCFLNFIIQKINSKIFKSRMVVLIGREKADADEL